MVNTTLKTIWNGNIKGNGKIKTDNLETNIALPEKSGGTGKGANPKEILTSSAAACYVMTLVSVIETSALAIEQLQMETVINDLKDNEFEIVHCPQLTLSDNATENDFQTANKLFDIAENTCFISNLLQTANVKVYVKSTVVN